MAEIQRILFSPHLYICNGIYVLRVDEFDSAGGPFLKYARDGREPLNLRIRITSSIFRGRGMQVILLDHLENEEEDKLLRRKMIHIAQLINWVYAQKQPTRKKPRV